MGLRWPRNNAILPLCNKSVQQYFYDPLPVPELVLDLFFAFFRGFYMNTVSLMRVFLFYRAARRARSWSGQKWEISLLFPAKHTGD